MTRSEVDGLKSFVKDRVTKWHDQIKPDYIFLTETSAVPVGFLFREAWRAAYPTERPPTFYRVDPVALGLNSNANDFNEDTEYKKKLRDFFKRRIKKSDAKIVVFDECSLTGRSPEKVRERILEYTDLPRKNIDIDKGDINQPFQLQDGQLVHMSMGTMTGLKNYPKFTKKSGTAFNPDGLGKGKVYRNTDEIKLRGRIKGVNDGEREIRDDEYRYPPEEREKARVGSYSVPISLLDYKHDLKLAGKIVGEQIRHEREQRKTLEHKVAVLIGGIFILSIIFSSLKISGLVVGGTASNYFNLVGMILFLTGLVISIIYVRLNR